LSDKPAHSTAIIALKTVFLTQYFQVCFDE
jgi:hypothetical protein